MTRGCLLLVAALATPAGSPSQSLASPLDAALREGNALFRDGDLEAALRAFAADWDPAAPDPLLAYNLGATAHRLGRLPEAIVWYRRAQLAGGSDPWLGENLDLARRELALPPPAGPPGLAAWAARRDGELRLSTIALSWAALLALFTRRGGAWAPATLAALVVLVGGAALAARVWGPRPAVLVAACGDLAAGSEVWVDAGAEGWRVAGGDRERPCPAPAVALLRPDGRGPKT